LEKAKNKLFLITSHLLAELDEIISEVILMHDGVVRFHKETHLLKEETGKNTLSKAIAYMLREEQV
jgi:Cu-processing system ATP-binding protein